MEEQLLSLVGSLSLGQANSGQHAVGRLTIMMEMEVTLPKAMSGLDGIGSIYHRLHLLQELCGASTK